MLNPGPNSNKQKIRRSNSPNIISDQDQLSALLPKFEQGKNQHDTLDVIDDILQMDNDQTGGRTMNTQINFNQPQHNIGTNIMSIESSKQSIQGTSARQDSPNLQLKNLRDSVNQSTNRLQQIHATSSNEIEVNLIG